MSKSMIEGFDFFSAAGLKDPSTIAREKKMAKDYPSHDISLRLSNETMFEFEIIISSHESKEKPRKPDKIITLRRGSMEDFPDLYSIEKDKTLTVNIECSCTLIHGETSFKLIGKRLKMTYMTTPLDSTIIFSVMYMQSEKYLCTFPVCRIVLDDFKMLPLEEVEDDHSMGEDQHHTNEVVHNPKKSTVSNEWGEW